MSGQGEMMDQIERIARMERILNESVQAVQALLQAIARFEGMQDAMRELEAYYTGEAWRQDYEDDEAGRLPADLCRGVLSEDAVYNLLLQRDMLLDRLSAAKAHGDAPDKQENHG